MATLTLTRTAGPNLILVAALLSVAYLADLGLTMAGYSFHAERFGGRGFEELNPVVGGHVNEGAWLMPALLKFLGVLLIWYGVVYFRSTPFQGAYGWLLGGFAILYLMLDTYQLVNLI